MKPKIRISQCMIVKNEEKNLSRALSWGKDIMWEQIVVDTGSSDQTVPMARQMGAKVFHFPWIDDFSAAKNYAIDQALGDWIVFLDADESFTPEDAAKLPALLDRLDGSGCDAISASWIQVNSGEELVQRQSDAKMDWLSTVREDGSQSFSLAGMQIRIFRSRPGLRYQGRIHEKLYLDNVPPACFDASGELAILHTGYSPEEMKEKDKTGRNIALVKKELEDRPHDYQMLAYLGDSCFQQKEYEEAARWYEQAARYLPDDLEEDNIQGAMLFKHLLLIYQRRPDEPAALGAYERGRARFAKDADYDYLMGRHQAELGHYQEAAHHLQNALAVLEQHNCPTSLLLSRNLLLAWELLIQCHCENGDVKSCASLAITLLRADPRRPEPLKYLLLSFRKDAERAAAQADKSAQADRQPHADGETRSRRESRTDRRPQTGGPTPADRPAQTGGHAQTEEPAPAQAPAASPAQVLAFLGNLYDLGNSEQYAFVRNAAKEAGYDGLLKEMA